MSNEVVSWKEELAKSAQAVAKLERPSIGAISLKSGVMTYQDQAIPGNKLPAVVVGFSFENQYFASAYDPNRPASPDCFSLSLDGKGMTPHPEAGDIQHDGLCDTCPMMKWGTGRNGKGKACKAVRKLVLIPADVLSDPEKVEAAELTLLKVPLTSVKNWSNYVNSIAAKYNRPPWGIVTEITVHPHVKNQFEVKFNDLSLIGDEALGAIFKRLGFVNDLLLTPYAKNDEEPEEAPPAKGSGKKQKF